VGAKHLQQRHRRLPLARLTASALLGTLLVGLVTTPSIASGATDLSITNAQAPVNPVAVGGTATYTLTVANTAANIADSVQVVDTIPVGGVFAGYTATVGSCLEAPVGTVTCALGDMSNPASETITIDVTYAAAGSYSNSATVSAAGTTSDTDSSNNTAAVTTQVGSADVSITKTDGVTSYIPGQNLTYTLTLANAGPDAASGVVVSDTLVGSTFVSCTPTVGSCGAAGAIVTWNVGSVANGATPSATLVVKPDPAKRNALANTASVTSTNYDPTPGNNSAIDSDGTATPQVDLALAKTTAAVAIHAGDTFTYTLTVTNAGPSTATGVVITDTLPTGLTYVSSTGGGVAAGSTVTWTLAGPIAPLGTASVDLTVKVADDQVNPFTNTATVTSAAGETDTNPANNTASLLSTLNDDADVAVTMIGDPTTAAGGDTVTFTVAVTNLGPAPAENVIATDIVPAGFTIVEPVPAPATSAAGTWTWTVGRVLKDETKTLTFDVTVDANAVGPTLGNTVNVTSDANDMFLENNTATAITTILAGDADLEVLSAADNEKPNKGDEIAIAIQVVNDGPSDATNVVLKDVLPNGLKYESCAGCLANGGTKKAQWTGLFTAGLIPAGTTATVILNVKVQASEGILKNVASIQSSDQNDPDGSNDRSTLKIDVGGSSANSGSGNGNGGTGGAGGTAFTGFTAQRLLPWFIFLFTIGLVAVELSRRTWRPIGVTYGFDEPF
jgi:uncharacterized repeat protein (TIGR01451 family)